MAVWNQKKRPPWYIPPFNGVPQSGRASRGAGTMALSGPGRARFFGGSNSPFRGSPLQPQSNPYGGLIGGQPDLSGLEAEFGAAGREGAAARDAALRRFVISYGQVPDFDKMGISESARGFLGGAIDQRTRDLAAKAEAEGLSVHARMAKENTVANRRIPSMLAGRGMLRSGQTGYDMGEQAQNYKIGQYDTLNELLSNVEGTVGNYLQGERDRQMQLAQARMQAAWDAYSNWGDYDMGPAQVPSSRGSLAGTSLPMAARNRAGRPWRSIANAPGQRNRR